ncbi:hypothetical protein HNR46_004155 [Haloferula luteola]|uniref:Uncharacterized protein n=1 Tax=Haloferula luteola TaxID=595692 RepID=A0A840VMP2_9BACT|nr:hypothetical protein [Haloferula luteola]
MGGAHRRIAVAGTDPMKAVADPALPEDRRWGLGAGAEGGFRAPLQDGAKWGKKGP